MIVCSILLLLFACVIVVPAVAQTTGSMVGLYAKALIISHQADFQEIPGTQSCCTGFQSGSGFGISVGGEYWLPLSSAFQIGGLLGVVWQEYELTSQESTYIIVDGNGQTGRFEHQLTGTMFSLGIEPRIAWSPTSWLTTSVGAVVMVPLSTSFQQQDQIVEPADQGTFIGADGEDSGSRIRNVYSGSLPDPATTVSPTLNVAFVFPMNAQRTWTIGPEISGQFGITNIISGVDWRSSAVGIGVRLTHVSVAERSELPESIQADSAEPIVLIEFGVNADTLSSEQQRQLIAHIEQRRKSGTKMTVEYRPSTDPQSQELQQRRVDFLHRLFVRLPGVDADLQPLLPDDQGITTQFSSPLEIFRVRFTETEHRR